MNIKEHIEAGHYPVDDKGRALVPMHGGGTATIGAICDHNGLPLLGWSDRSAYTWWDKWGRNERDDSLRLLPPSPRKVKVTAWASVVRGGTINSLHFHKQFAKADTARLGNSFTVELTGEYEQPWDTQP